MRTYGRAVWLTGFLLTGLVISAYLLPERLPDTDPSSLRHPAAGPVTGLAGEHNTHYWLGIPYARAGRWQAPEPLPPWQTAKEATSFGPFCSQYGGPAVTLNPFLWGDILGSEDCLHLNIWAPAYTTASVPRSEGLLPVMLWIHGGGNSAGRADSYDMAALAGMENVIVVTINYRLGALGWFTHPALQELAASAEESSGNYGTLDIIQSLRWVQDNIEAFGGNPKRVTVFGESAGGRNVLSLLASPIANGLFHGAIVQSGLSDMTTPERATNYRDSAVAGDPGSSAEVLLSLLMEDGSASSREDARKQVAAMSSTQVAAYLRSKSPQQLIPHYPEVGMGMYLFPQLIRDGHVLPKQDMPSVLANPKRHNIVPVILGTNRDEAKLFLLADPSVVATRFGLFRSVVDPGLFEIKNRYLSDYWRADAVDQLADALAQSQPGKVWAYRFDWDEGGDTLTGDYAQLYGAAHSLEMPFVFRQWQGLSMPGVFNDENRPAAEELSRIMMGYWGAFAHQLKPGNGRGHGPVDWQAWQASPAPARHIIFDTHANGGVRMAAQRLTMTELKTRLATDTAVENKQLRCELYARMFYRSRAWRADEYEQLGCAAWPPDALL